jgi:hypothetical protein
MGDVYGKAAACKDDDSQSCNVRSAEQDETGGFSGGYSPPSLVTGGGDAQEPPKRILSEAEHSLRELQVD